MDLRKIRRELSKKTDHSSAVEKEKVDRYVNLVGVFYELDESIEKAGVMVKIENGSQVFWKANPAIAEKNRINSALIALEKSFKPVKAPIISAKQPASDDSKGGLV